MLTKFADVHRTQNHVHRTQKRVHGKSGKRRRMNRYLFVVCSPSFIFRSANEGLTKDNKPQINIRPNHRNIKMSKHKRLVIVIFGEV